MEAVVIEDAKILIPNKDHLNFTESNGVLKADTIVNGEPKYIKGKRRGNDFLYRLFATSDNKIIYLNKIKPMKTEVQFGADSEVSPTVVSVNNPKKLFSKSTIIGALVGAGLGLAYSKGYKKMSAKKVAMWTSIGAVVGFGVGVYIDRRKPVLVNKSK